jgi:tRNA-dihydrouridine synthase A
MAVAAAGCKVFVVHARTAILSGLSPKHNREIHPLRYEIVRRLRADFANLVFILNGGIRSSLEVVEHLRSFDGVMIGREAYQNPYWLTELHQRIADPGWQPPTREAVVAQYSAYLQTQLEMGVNVAVAVRHVQGLYAGLPGARAWRRFVGERCIAGGQPQLLLESLRIVRQAA